MLKLAKNVKIGIDARLYGPKQGGLGRYVEQLILNLEKLNPAAEFVIFLKKENFDEYEPSRPNFKKVLADIPWYGFAEQVKFPKILKENKVDLMHFPHWNVPLFYKGPFVVTIHDLILYHFPDRRASTLPYAVYLFKQVVFKLVLKNAAKSSKKIITISEFSSSDIQKSLKIPKEKISITYPAPYPANIFLQNSTSKNFGIKKLYALYVGVAFPHKNLERLLEAWDKFSQKNNYSHQLVLAGKRNYFYDRLIKDFVHLFENGSVIFTDFVSDTELDHLYKKASLFIYPSLYEGFGIPPLEAMTQGVPVAASNASCIPEILQGSALYFDPKNVDEMASTFEVAFSDEILRAELTKLGLRIVKRYDWQKLASQTFEIYKNSV